MALRRVLNNSATLLLVKSTKFPLSIFNTKSPRGQNFQPNLQFIKCFCCDKNRPSNLANFRHNYPDELEGAINQQILSELNASMVYLSMFSYYGRTDIALPGCQAFFKAMYDEEQGHALELIEYQLMRGGEVRLYPITVPEDSNWHCITVALGVALELEKIVKDKLQALVELAECHKDLQLMDFITSKFLKEQNESICEMGRLLTKAKRLVDTGGVGRHLFDKDVFKYVQDKNPSVKLPYKNI